MAICLVPGVAYDAKPIRIDDDAASPAALNPLRPQETPAAAFQRHRVLRPQRRYIAGRLHLGHIAYLMANLVADRHGDAAFVQVKPVIPHPPSLNSVIHGGEGDSREGTDGSTLLSSIASSVLI